MEVIEQKPLYEKGRDRFQPIPLRCSLIILIYQTLLMYPLLVNVVNLLLVDVPGFTLLLLLAQYYSLISRLS